MKKLLTGLLALLLTGGVLAQSYPSPTYNNLTVQGIATLTNHPLAVSSGGTNSAVAGGATLDNITGFSGTGFLTRTGAGAYAFQSLTNGIALGSLAQIASNTVLANMTGATGNVAALSLPSCSSANSALQYISGTGLSCGTTFALTSGTLAQFAATTSAQLAGVVSDETGSGSLVFAGSPSLTGAPTAPTATAGTSTTQIATTAFVQAAAGIGRLLNVQVITSSGTYTQTPGTTKVIVEVQAPGGGGGGAAATSTGQSAVGSGGGSGAYAKVLVTSGFNGATVTIGAAGTGGTAGANAGTTGGTTSFGSFVSCPGGVGGSGGVAVTGPAFENNAGVGGAVPTISGAMTIVSIGGTAAAPGVIVVAGGQSNSGQGGSSQYGAGGRALIASSLAGAVGTGFGAGGGGGANSSPSSPAVAGGNAAGAVVIVWEYS